MIRKRRGVTLIELAVVVSVMGVTAATLAPAASNGQEQKKVSHCVNNLRQWGRALQGYLSDYDQRFPWAGTNNLFPHSTMPRPFGMGPGSKTCSEALKPYAGPRYEQILFCLAWQTSPQSGYWPRIDWSYWYFCPHNNVYVGQHPKSALCGYGMADVMAPEKKPFLTELNLPHDNGSWPVPFCMVFCDGHANAESVDSYEALLKIVRTGRDGTQ